MKIYQYSVKDIDGNDVPLEKYRGKILLIVNTASKCGFTPQYTELEELYQKYHKQGFEILAFPCNQFGGQEPGQNEEIKQFCSLNYNTTFPLFAKLDVNGQDAHPLYQFLSKEAGGVLGNAIKWNFTKFLIDRDGNVLDRYAPTTNPLKLDKIINSLLA